MVYEPDDATLVVSVQETDHWISLPLDAIELGVRFPKRGKKVKFNSKGKIELVN